jgi:hypothetical protein
MKTIFRYLDEKTFHHLIKMYDPFQRTNNNWVEYYRGCEAKIMYELDMEIDALQQLKNVVARQEDTITAQKNLIANLRVTCADWAGE